MIFTNLSTPVLKSEAALEYDRAYKARLLKIFCLITLALEIGAVLEVASIALLFKDVRLSAFGVIGLSVVMTGVSYRWAQAGIAFYRRAGWMLVASITIALIGNYIQTGTAVPFAVAFMLPIVIAVILLEVQEAIITTAICTAFTIILYLVEDVLEIYQPPSFSSHYIYPVTAIFIVAVVFPALAAMLIIPAQASARNLHNQNRQLSQALHEIEARQQSGQLVSGEVLSLAAELKTTAIQQAGGSQEQAVVVRQVNATVSEFSDAAASIARLAEQVNTASDTMAEDSLQIEETTSLSVTQSEQGLAAVERTSLVSQEVAELYQAWLKMMEELNTRSAKMRRVLELLKSIASETHLLALNAAIEAAGAGDYGLRFAVVAQEVRNLAARSGTASQEVVGIIEEIEGATELAVRSAQGGFQKALEMEQVAGEAGTVIAGMRQVSEHARQQAGWITDTARRVKHLAEIIGAATGQQQIASQHMMSALSGLSVVAQQNAASSTLISSTADNLEKMSHDLNTTLAA